MTGPRGAKYVAGHTNDQGYVVLTRDDESETTVPDVILCTGTLVDNGDGTWGITGLED